jgi:hypothetical protein
MLTSSQGSETGQGIASPQCDAGDECSCEQDALPPSLGLCPICGLGWMCWTGKAWHCDSAGTGRCSYGMTVEAFKRERDLAQRRIRQLPARGTRRP